MSDDDGLPPPTWPAAAASGTGPTSDDGRGSPLRPGEDPLKNTFGENVAFTMLFMGAVAWGFTVLQFLALAFDLFGVERLSGGPPLLGLVLLVIGARLMDAAENSQAYRRRAPARAVAQAESERRHQERLAVAEEQRREETAEQRAQMEAWGYGPDHATSRRWPPRGFITLDVRPGSRAYGQPVPAWSTFHLELAPADRPDLAARIAPQRPGPCVEVPVADLLRLSARSRAGGWFGFGATGAMAAHAASALDRQLAGFELSLVTKSGFDLQLRKLGGAPPATELQTINARAAGFEY